MSQSVVGGSSTAGDGATAGQAAPRRRIRRSTWLYALAITVTLSIVAFNVIRPIVVLPRIAPSPGFALVGSDGQPVTSEDRRGFLTLYSFSYLDCATEYCPQSIDDIAALRQAIADTLPADTPLQFVTISLDPERDTPERLRAAEAARALPAGAPGWLLLTGDPTRTRATVGGGFGVYYSQPDTVATPAGRVSFDPRYVLVDHLGIMRAEYRSGTPDPALIARDVNLLLEEAANSSGVVRLGYEAAHLFLCYPR